MALKTTLHILRTSLKGNQVVEVGADPLAITRPNTTAILNTSAIHARAGQLSLTRRWIKIQRDLLTRLENYEGVRRILKARLITDIVSFCDCLVTRAVPVNSPQEMDGLDKLIVRSGQSASPIVDFLNTTHFTRNLEELRAVRDTIGAHLEIDSNVPLSKLLWELDRLNLGAYLKFYDMVQQIFDKVCRNIMFLRTSAIDGARLNAISAPNNPSVVPFNDRELPLENPNCEVRIDFNSTDNYTLNLEKWLHGDDIAQEDARYFFYQAFMCSEQVEEVVETEHFGEAGFSRHSHQLRKAHQFIIDELKSQNDRHLIAKIFHLLSTCRPGAPYILAEILVRHAQSHFGKYDDLVCDGLGAITFWPHGSVEQFLTKHAAHNGGWNVRFRAIIAAFKIFIRSEGILKINRKISRRTYKEEILPLTSSMTDIPRLLCKLSFASQFVTAEFGTYANQFQEEYHSLQSEIESLCNGSELADICMPVKNTVQQLIATHDYVGLCVVISDQLTQANKTEIAKEFLVAACTGAVAAAPHDDAIHNLAVCFQRNGDVSFAHQLAEDLAKRNPDQIERQIFTAQILASKSASKNLARDKIEMIKDSYILTDEHQKTLTALEQHLASLE